MKIWQPALYRKIAQKKGLSHSIINNAIKIYTHFSKTPFPCILTINHLSKILNIPYPVLKKCTYKQIENYKSFSIKKRSGGTRRIYSPNYNLLRIQQWINREILQKDPNISEFSYAFRKGLSTRDCAFLHCNQSWLIKIDIKNYFESISEIDVYKYFNKLGYNKLLSFQLARICTVNDNRNMTLEKLPLKFIYYKNKKYKFLQNPEIGFLPQGAATSPMLANLITSQLDVDINVFLQSLNLDFNYSRYADDIFISTNSKQINDTHIRKIINSVYSIIISHGFEPNKSKTKVSRPGKRKNLLGINVNSSEVKLTKHFRNILECHLFYFKKDKIQHASNRGFKTIFGAATYIHGLLSYAEQIDSNYVKKLRKKYQIDTDFFNI